MTGDGISLLDFLDAPVVVGDPDGHVAYVNPAFGRAFPDARDAALGAPVAQLFEGGGREALLGAVAEVCGKGQTVRFRLREEGRGYLGVASPIAAGEESVGVIILLSDEPLEAGRLLGIQRSIVEPIEEVAESLDLLLEQTGGRREERHRSSVESAMQALERARKSCEDLAAVLSGKEQAADRTAALDAARVARTVASRVAPEFERSEAGLELLLPAQLPPAQGDASQLETVLVRMLRDRLLGAAPGFRCGLSARRARVGGRDLVLVSVTSPSQAEGRATRSMRDSIAALGGCEHISLETPLGRVTTLVLQVSPTAP